MYKPNLDKVLERAKSVEACGHNLASHTEAVVIYTKQLEERLAKYEPSGETFEAGVWGTEDGPAVVRLDVMSDCSVVLAVEVAEATDACFSMAFDEVDAEAMASKLLEAAAFIRKMKCSR